MKPWVFLLLAAASSILAGCSRLGAVTNTATPDPDPCMVTGRVLARFVLPDDVSFSDVFPNAGDTSEFDAIEGLELIVYDGEVQMRNITVNPDYSPRTTAQDAVCVITPDGEPGLYINISREGMDLPDGAQ